MIITPSIIQRNNTWGSNADCVLFYAKSSRTKLNPLIIKDFTEDEIAQRFPRVDERGERYNTKKTAWRFPSMGIRPNLCYSFYGITPPYPSGWRLRKERMEEEYRKGNIVIKNGILERRSYLRDYRGVSPGNVWTDTELLLGAHSTERVGYPTQKPIALLERIIQASSNPSDVILDPFCGCATACLAAEKHGRQWVGIDVSPKAFDLIKIRMRKELGLFGHVNHRTDIPQRTDQGPVVSYKTHKHTLFGKQEGVCNGCRHSFQFRNFTIDHVVPQAKGGTDHLDNLQPLCGACNSMKGAGTQEALIAKLKQEGIR